MEAPRNYNDSFFDINNLFNFQDEQKLDGDFEDDLLFKSFSPLLIDSEYEKKSNSIEKDTEEPISLTIKIGEKEIPVTSFNCAKLENVTKENLIEIENKIKHLSTRKQRHDLTKRIKCATKLLENAEEIPTIIVDKEEFHITCLGHGEYLNLSKEQLKTIKNRMRDLPSAEKNKLYSKLFTIRKKNRQNQPKKIPTIKIGEKEIPITSFNCTKLENVTEEKLIEIENKIEDLFTLKQKREVTTRIKCAKKLLKNAEKIPTIIVDTEEFHITCIGHGEYKNLSEEQLKIIKNQMSDLPYAERNKLSSKLYNTLKKKQKNQPKEIPTIKIGEKEIPITSFNCTKLKNVTKKKLREMENKIEDLPTRKQKYALKKRIKCAREQLLDNAEKIPTIRVDKEKFHITCLGYGEYINLSKEQLKIIKNQISDLSRERKHQLNKKLESRRREKARNAQDKEIPTIKIGEKEIPITSFNCTRLENVTKKKLREIENKIEDFFTREQKYALKKRIKCARQLLDNAEKIPTIRVDTEEFHITCLGGYKEYKNLSEEQLKIIQNQMSDLPSAEKNKLSSKLSKVIKNKQNQSNEDFKNKSIQTHDSLLEKNREQEEKSKPIEQDADNVIAEIDHFISNFFDSNREDLTITDKEYINKNSNSENDAELFISSILELDTHTLTVTQEQNDQENQQTENIPSRLKSKKRRWNEM